MLITKEQQERIVEKYVKDKHNTDKCIGFIDGINATIDLMNRILTPEFEIVKTTTECCGNCKDISTDGFAWIYCEVRKNNDEKFNDLVKFQSCDVLDIKNV